MILEFEDFETAARVLKEIDFALIQYWQKKNYTISEKGGQSGMVGKNVVTGRDDPLAARTMTWGEIYKSPVGTYYILSPFGNIRFCGTLPVFEDGLFVEKEFPQEWNKTPETPNAGFFARLRTFLKRLPGVFRGRKG